MKRGMRNAERGTGKRSYDDQIDTTVRALRAIYGERLALRALARLQANWPEVDWPQRLAEIHVAVISEPDPIETYLEDRK